MTQNPSVEAAVARSGRSVKARLRTWVVRLVLAGLLIAVTLVVGGGVQAVVNVPDLQPWHRLVPRGELRAADLDDAFTLQQYLAREAAVFRQVRDEVDPRGFEPAGYALG